MSIFQALLCECGCGEPTPLATRTRPYLGTVQGWPVRFVSGHGRRKSPVPYVVDPETGCWRWQRAKGRGGYSSLFDPAQGRVRPAHVVYYEREYGPVPAGLQLDHVRARGCRYRDCVNPSHLEPVTNAENTQRGTGAKLTPEAVCEIRASTETAAMAQRFGVDRTLIQQVRAGRIWRNVV
jgi:hypothetical protein